MARNPSDVVVTIGADTTEIDAALDRVLARIREVAAVAALAGIHIETEANVEKRETDEAT